MKTNLKTILFLFILAGTLFSCKSDDPTEPTTNPNISNISPTSGPKTTIVTINGNDFGTNNNAVKVYFNDVEAMVQTVTDTQIITVVPARAYTGLVKVFINGTELIGPTFNYTITDIQVSTFAGDGIAGFLDGQGTAAKFSKLGQIAIDANGTIYVADTGNHKIRKITPSGVVSTLAGSTEGNVDGQGVNAKFNFPYGIVVDNQNNVYVADSENHKIRKITPNGVVSTVAGNGSDGFAEGQGVNARFDTPYGLAIDSQNNLYVTDSYNNRIRKITPSGLVSTFAGSGINGSADGQGVNAEFTSPIGIVVDSENNVYIGDEGNHTIRKITPNANVTTLAGGTGGNANGQGANAQFTSPTGLTIDKQGNIYVADYNNHRIRKITPNGLVSTFVGSDLGYVNGQGVNAKFYNPYHVIIDTNYDVYIVDRGNYRIRKITQE